MAAAEKVANELHKGEQRPGQVPTNTGSLPAADDGGEEGEGEVEQEGEGVEGVEGPGDADPHHRARRRHLHQGPFVRSGKQSRRREGEGFVTGNVPRSHSTFRLIRSSPM